MRVRSLLPFFWALSRPADCKPAVVKEGRKRTGGAVPPAPTIFGALSRRVECKPGFVKEVRKRTGGAPVFSPVAELEMHPTFNRVDVGAAPTGRTNFTRRLWCTSLHSTL